MEDRIQNPSLTDCVSDYSETGNHKGKRTPGLSTHWIGVSSQTKTFHPAGKLLSEEGKQHKMLQEVPETVQIH